MIAAIPVSVPEELLGVPEITHVSFDTRRLEIQVMACHAAEPEYLAAGYCLFAACAGFRVLEEGDLLEFWALEPRPSGWLWHIQSGGWLAQEKQREGFFSSRPSGPNWPSPQEFLVVGQEYCVSVLAHREPTIWVAEPFIGSSA